MDILTKAIILAAQGHDGQTDKGGQPYILHPLRVMQSAKGEDERIVAVLHDLVEDTGYTLAHLAGEGFPDEIVQAVDCLTKRDGEAYDAFIDRIRANPLASRVKILDISDNMDLGRIASPTQEDHDRLDKYRRALVALNQSE